MTLSQAAAAIGARVQGADVAFQRVSTDTRSIKKGDLFVALRGERFDGHEFVATAAEAGAAAAMVDARSAVDTQQHALPALIVDDTRLALGRLGSHWRSRFDFPVVALTGSSGKTTVKEMIAAILRVAAGADDAVLATRGNLNNDIGVPLMLLEMKPGQRYAVIETGMNHAGEIRYLCELAKPDVVLVTNAGTAHIEYLGSAEAIARAKGEIFEAAPADAVAVINADDVYAPLWRKLAGNRRVVDFGLKGAAVTGTYRLRDFDSEIVLKTTAGVATASVAAPGLHNVRNALAAAAAAVALDIPVTDIAKGLARYAGIKGRLQRKAGAGGAVVVDDTYNANPESVRAAIDVLAQAGGTRILAFGDMGELGADAPRLHEELGSYARNAGVNRVLALGEHAALTARAFGAGAQHFATLEALVAALRPALGKGVTVLVKGSRFMKMERVVDAIAADAAGGPACS